MASTTENVKLGVCSVIYGGKSLGFTKGGVEVAVETQTYEITVDQMGTTPIGERITGRTVTATVPLAEATLENLVEVMPGATLVTNGAKATGTVTFATAVPANGDSVTVNGIPFTFRTKATNEGEVTIGTGAGAAGLAATAANFAAAINAAQTGFIAVAAAGVVTLTAKTTGTGWNGPIDKAVATPANVTTTALAGGTDATAASVTVSNAISMNLLSLGKPLVLRPKGTFGEDDFTIFSAACPGALNFSYSNENERLYSAAFKGYAQADGRLFKIGN
ncbi:hypothetical protein [Paracoccus litorisediminis]|uniref:Uncharacterized protein n=1 Tax=Paracoccus litorisediminis TaxID=2006130 RepID=A0A844HUL9_9RHOB|nr:hypothetical protein [Paracoccus litorisediminis]MTH61202.1 hypothetical protein [Paracoccus litorisediminis]